jgi:hypothetical protein
MVMATGALIATGTHHTGTTITAQATPADAPTNTSRPTSVHHDDQAVTMPAATVEPAPVPAHLLPNARFAATNHEHTTGRPITPEELSARIGITPAVAGQLLTHLSASTPTPARVNGTAITTGGAR